MISFGATFFVVSKTYQGSNDLDERNSTDNLATKTLLEETTFHNNKIKEGWTISSEVIINNEVAVLNQKDLHITSPTFEKPFTKYIEIQVDEVTNPLDGQINVLGYDDKLNLLETLVIPINEQGIYQKRFAYDHVFIKQISFVYFGSETSLSIAYLGIYALQ